MLELIAYLTTTCIWLAIGIVVLWVFTRERRSYKRHYRRGVER